MDMFKLLVRSTGLHKSTVGAGRAPQSTPSAGDFPIESNHTRAADQPVDFLKGEVRGTKRKRHVVEERKANIPDELNFFVGQNGQAKPTSNKDNVQTKDARRLSGNEDGNADSVESHSGGVGLNAKFTTCSEEECRRIFKKHKLKITVLGDAETTHKPGDAKTLSSSRGNPRKKLRRRELWPQPLSSFKDLRNKYCISTRLAENLVTQGYKEPTEVQVGALPLLLGSDNDRGLVASELEGGKKQYKSDVDLITVAPTGSGKTLAFLIPIIQSLVEDKRNAKTDCGESAPKRHVQALIVVPTHELADQIADEAKRLTVGTGVKASGMKKGMKIFTGLADGTDDRDNAQRSDPLVKADILVSTPMMILHAISDPSGDTSNALPSVRFLVLDEADVLLDPLFRSQTLSIWTALTHPHLRTTLWSATIGSSIETLAQEFIHTRRARLNLPQNSPSTSTPTNHHILRLVVGLKDTAVPQIAHRLTYAASEQGKLHAIRQLLSPSTSTDMTILPPYLIFTQTIPRATALHAELLYDIPPEAGGSSRIAVLHSALSTTARAAITAGLRTGEIWVVITTDLLSRGLDIRGLNGVVNYDIPTTSAAYVHRVGRTGRQGRSGGVAITLYTKEDIPYVKNIANVIAASERQQQSHHQPQTNPSSSSSSIQPWLLAALPTLSKNTKRELKERGVASRRPHPPPQRGPVDASARRSAVGLGMGVGRISTKSGYERRIEGRRKGAREGNLRRRGGPHGSGDGDGDDGGEEEWTGFD